MGPKQGGGGSPCCLVCITSIYIEQQLPVMSCAASALLKIFQREDSQWRRSCTFPFCFHFWFEGLILVIQHKTWVPDSAVGKKWGCWIFVCRHRQFERPQILTKI
ncbi:hypothetical protein GDO81_023783 [Engystomops pustulosus]|uniref:Uncharacterized protein n=1 Tax=Engystomops pustulosus TaxID=76066 RepID=A0AAV6ZN66_ENGPU|nr:hypothetical protein GDO81_023783 [Engystomops pustulosus]